MRQFLLGANVAYPTTIAAAVDGAIAFSYLKNGVEVIDSDGSGIVREGNIVFFRTEDKGGNVILPFFKNNFSYVKGVYTGATTFKTTFTVTAPTAVGDYSIIVVKKGVKFNERNKWTASVHIADVSTTAIKLATDLAVQINNNSEGSGVSATVSAGVITITATKAGVDYVILGADRLQGTDGVVVTQGNIAYGDAKYVQDLAEKAAADAGFEYTYRDAYYYMYPDYPLNPLRTNDATDTGFTIFTIRFAEPRNVKTTDEVVNQIIQVAFPTGSAAITSFEKVCKGLAGESVTTSA